MADPVYRHFRSQCHCRRLTGLAAAPSADRRAQACRKDTYHARQHLWDLAASIFSNEKERKRWAGRLQARLDSGKIGAIVRQLRSFLAFAPEVAELLRIEADYFARNAERMRYPQFRKQKLFVGSGVIEAACRTVIAQRLKLSGMFWTVRGANAIIALRCCLLNREFEDHWASRSKAA